MVLERKRSWLLAVALMACGRPSTEPTISNTAAPARLPADAAPISDREAAMRAHVEAETAVREMEDARRRIEQLTQQLAVVERKIAEAVERVVEAQTDAERANGKDELVLLQAEKAALDARVRQEIERANDAERRANGM